MSLKKLITKKVEFSASHRYWNDDLTESENAKFFGKACSQHGHGHNFILEVTVQGEINEQTGMIINLFDLKKITNEILLEFDHKNLNTDTPYFRDKIPTPENIAIVLWNLLDERFSGLTDCTLYKIRLYETEDLYVDYWG